MLGFYNFTSGHYCKKYTGTAQPCQLFCAMQSEYIDPLKGQLIARPKRRNLDYTQAIRQQNWSGLPFVQIYTYTDGTEENGWAAQEKLLVFFQEELIIKVLKQNEDTKQGSRTYYNRTSLQWALKSLSQDTSWILRITETYLAIRLSPRLTMKSQSNNRPLMNSCIWFRLFFTEISLYAHLLQDLQT